MMPEISQVFQHSFYNFEEQIFNRQQLIHK